MVLIVMTQHVRGSPFASMEFKKQNPVICIDRLHHVDLNIEQRGSAPSNAVVPGIYS